MLKVHVLAALDALEKAGIQASVEVAKDIAEAVVTATDSMTRYCVVVLEAPKTTWIYGPYATFAAATKAVEGKHLGTKEGAKGFVLPMIPAPKVKREKKK